jgi:Na+-driven multidrug efflux pump
MRAVLSFFSMLALGLMIAAIVVIGATGGASGPGRLPISGPYLDYVSVVIGLGVGLVIAVLGQISWSELPHRAAQWVLAHGRRLRLLAWGALFVAVLLYF